MKKQRFGIVGTNFISDRFVEAVNDTSSCEAVAVYSRNQATADAFCAKHSIKQGFTSYIEMLRSDIDAVYIASPTYCHSSQAILAMNMGKDVLCEKMLAHNSAAALEMIKVAKDTGRVLLEATRPLFDPSFSLIKDATNKIGRVRRVDLGYSQYSSRYDKFKSGEVLNAFDPAIANSALADIGIYPLELCLALFGKPEKTSGDAVFLDNGFLASGVITLKYPDMLATVTYSKIADGFTPSVIEGECGSVIIDGVNKTKSITLCMRGGKVEKIDYTPKENNMSYEIEAFARKIGRAHV